MLHIANNHKRTSDRQRRSEAREAVVNLLSVMVMNMDLGLLPVAINTAMATIYEDAEDLKTDRWSVFDGIPLGASITNVDGEEKGGRVIQLQGSGRSNAYIIGNVTGSEGTWANSTEFNAEWSIKSSEFFQALFSVETAKGRRYMNYTPIDVDGGVRGGGISLGLGKQAINGKWNTHACDLKADLKKHDPDNVLLKINGLLIRGSLKIDDISLSSCLTYEDAEDGSTLGWNILDNIPAGATVTNINDFVKGGKVIELKGDGANNAFELGGKSGSERAWNNKSNTTIKWSGSFTEHFTIYIQVLTTKGFRYLFYTPINTDAGLVPNSNVHHGLGIDAKDGNWHSFTRDLQADLQQYDPDNAIISVDGFMVRGSGKVDDISLCPEDKDTTMDSNPPVITLTGDAEIVIPVGSTFVDPGAVAVDDKDGIVPVTKNGEVDTSVARDEPYIITYKATDTSGNEAEVQRRVIVAAIDGTNKPPVAENVEVTGSEDTAIEVILKGSDPDGDALTYSIVSPPQFGTLGDITDNKVTYTPKPDFYGTDSFTYNVSDGALSSTATVTITVEPVSEFPSDEEKLVVIEKGEDDISKAIGSLIPEIGSVFSKVDIMFIVDVSGSYSDDLSIFRAKANELIAAFAAAGADVKIGLSSFSDFPRSPYGASFDYPFRLDQALTSEYDTVVTAINNLRILSGSDGPESQLTALYETAQAVAGWRDGSLPVIFLATDARFHNSDEESAYPGRGYTETLAALRALGAKVFGLQSGGTISDVTEVVTATDGLSFSLSRNSAEIVAAIEDAIDDTAKDLTIKLEPLGDYAGLVKSITPKGVAGAKAGDPLRNINAGDNVEFDVVFTRGIFAAGAPKTLKFRLQVIAEGSAVIKNIPITVELR